MSLRTAIPAPLRRALRPVRRFLQPQKPRPVSLVGYVRKRTTTNVAGWIQNHATPTERVAFEVVCTLPGATRVLARGRADQFDSTLAQLGVGDARYGFRVLFDQPITEAERDRVEVRPFATGTPIPDDHSPITGQLRERSHDRVAGWMQNPELPSRPVAFEVVCTRDGSDRVIASGIADQPDRALAAQGHRQPNCGFSVQFTKALSKLNAEHIEVRPIGGGRPIPFNQTSVAILGYLRERSARHVAGFIKNAHDPSQRVAFNVICKSGGSERILTTAVADLHDRILALANDDDPVHGFRIIFDTPVTEQESEHLEVRPIATGKAIPHAPDLQSGWKPIRYIAMDIVDNCNLRCPFCLFDHAPVHKTNVMSDETFESALRMLPYVGPEGHWMSCLHEPSMHPRFTDFIKRIPREYRHRMTYTTNMAKRMPDAYFEALASSGLSNLNMSIESRDPEIYEKMRKGARYRIFMENWEKLLAAYKAGSAPPPLRYIAMAYKSNYRELPSLIEWLFSERQAWKVEIRDTYVVSWIPQEFRDSEFLEHHEWAWLQSALAKYPPEQVSLVLPAGFDPDKPPAPAATPSAVTEPAAAADAAPAADATPAAETVIEMDEQQAAMHRALPGLVEARILHDGTMFVYSCPAGNYPIQGKTLATVNIRDIDDPESFLRTFTG